MSKLLISAHMNRRRNIAEPYIMITAETDSSAKHDEILQSRHLTTALRSIEQPPLDRQEGFIQAVYTDPADALNYVNFLVDQMGYNTNAKVKVGGCIAKLSNWQQKNDLPGL